MRLLLWPLLSACALLALFPGCPAQGIGDPCVPEDEYQPTFSGFSVNEVNTESRSFQCQSRLCLVNHFQGRVSCPYGQRDGEGRCRLPGNDEAVTVAVPAQLAQRRADDSVYCSCRCAGPDATARYCECPNGFSCTKVVPELSLGQAQLPGSYCIRAGSEYISANLDKTKLCDPQLANCEGE
ncbi:MAG TPA: hypothetical protein VHB79_30350 [Polyangiaceae bacterium]|nr:hypothetical protein [Polyangiaceae bacterium]